MEELSEIIIIDYGYLKAPEILLFLHRFKKGQYGQFYGFVDPMKIAVALNQHVKDRQGEISRIEEKEYKRYLDAQRKERAKNSISREEYERRKIMRSNLNQH